MDEITTQEYVAALGVANEAAAGYTGEGVSIAVIDGPADTTVPELAGADITVTPMCDFTASPDGRSHGTAMVSILAARGYGVARGAHITNYATPTPTAPPWAPHPDTTKRAVPTDNPWSAQRPGAMATTPSPSALSTNPGALRGS
ncbi:hypothetical protein [Schaalia georgiae]|uniref:hypothetical protein n=1 Tax=Schaalia georgiae TaxID=52768 RepID=UPI001A953BE6|nr:hypothetical protein [Schaalia georgiae]